MHDASPNLGLPFLAAGQAQKHVTMNEALALLDALAQLRLVALDARTPPSVPEEGLAWALGAAPTDAWAGEAGAVAIAMNGGWAFVRPRAGWIARDLSADRLVAFDGATWGAAGAVQGVDGVGVGTTSDPVNRLAVAAPASLFTHEGSDHRLVLNKAAPGDTGSVTFQTGWSGRAEIGLAGDDAFGVKVSADGATWTTALAADAGGVRIEMPVTGAAVQAAPDDAAAGRLMTVGAFGLGGDALGDLGARGALVRAGAGTAGRPPQFAESAGLSVGAPGGPAQAMLGTGADAGRAAVRAGTSDWAEIYTAASALGPVALSGGRPAGALIESVRTGRGGHVRLADGTQVVWMLVDVDVATTAPQSWPLPVPFAAGHVVSASASHAVPGAHPALACANRAVLGADASSAFLALGTAGTAAAPGTDAERLVLTLTGRWA